jgi:hypothetical protein
MGLSGFVSLAFLLIVMVICWIWGEQGLFTKLGFTGINAGVFGALSHSGLQ